MTRIRINEIFFSLQGETSRAGLPTVFVRLSGCPLRCDYCDTEYAFAAGKPLSIGEILAAVAKFPPSLVCVTGGEPLAQKGCLELLTALCDKGYDVSLETSGALDVSRVDARVSKILDIKTPDSGEAAKNRWQNLEFMHQSDEIKFVLCSIEDYSWAKNILLEKNLPSISPVLFSPVADGFSPRVLAELILADALPVRMQLQLHKLIWGAETGH